MDCIPSFVFAPAPSDADAAATHDSQRMPLLRLQQQQVPDGDDDDLAGSSTGGSVNSDGEEEEDGFVYSDYDLEEVVGCYEYGYDYDLEDRNEAGGDACGDLEQGAATMSDDDVDVGSDDACRTTTLLLLARRPRPCHRSVGNSNSNSNHHTIAAEVPPIEIRRVWTALAGPCLLWFGFWTLCPPWWSIGGGGGAGGTFGNRGPPRDRIAAALRIPSCGGVVLLQVSFVLFLWASALYYGTLFGNNRRHFHHHFPHYWWRRVPVVSACGAILCLVDRNPLAAHLVLLGSGLAMTLIVLFQWSVHEDVGVGVGASSDEDIAAAAGRTRTAVATTTTLRRLPSRGRRFQQQR